MTRARDASERFVANLPAELRIGAAGGPRLVISPLIDIVPRAAAVELDGTRGIVFTSANGVRVAAGLTGRRDLPCFCVGEATTALARAQGWPADCAGLDADGLVDTLCRRRPAAPLLHLRGANARGDVAQRLTAAGLETREQVIYDQPLRSLSNEAKEALSGSDPVIVPLFSPRVARHFASMSTGGAPLFLAAMSDAVANPLLSLDFKRLEVADRPDAAGMAEAVARLAGLANRVVGGSGPK